MNRKVNRVGHNTLTVSLPAKWVKKLGIRPGDNLSLFEQGSDLVIRHATGVTWGKTKIDIHKFGFFHQNFLSNVYHLGFDEVEVHFKEDKEFNHIQARLPQYIGFEIVDQGENYCVIKDISQTSELEFDNVLRRTFILLIEMSEKCEEAIRKKEFERLKEIRLLESMNNKFTDYCRRILNKKGYADSRKTNVVYTLVHDLERIGDEYKRICDHFSRERRPASKEILDLYHQLNLYLRTFYELFYKYNKEKLETILKEGQGIVEQLNRFLIGKNKDDAILAHHLIYITIGVYDLSYIYIEIFL
ncbi:MAG: AbrB/MazE/SpoVT family DNA-binding domain-containing protein [Nanoarchaeota archaeon]|nr:AbrB/MazE/SpoVT family DNA-binding domain-containing protein [Nanoarchaeota archaeon]